MTGRFRTWQVMITATTVATLSLTACGGPSSNGEANKPAAQVFKDAQMATEAEKSVHVTGKVTSSGSTIQLNLTAGTSAGGGTITQNGATLQIVFHQPNVYLMADQASWTKLTGSAATGRLLAGKWLQTTSGNKDFGALTNLVDITMLVGALSPSGNFTKGAVTTVNGTSVVPLVDQGSSHGTLDVAATGQPVFERIMSGGGKNGGVAFSQYGSAAIPPVPAGAINLDQLQQSGG